MTSPEINMQDDILDQASSWLASGHGVALATVVSTWGSSPRPVGSQEMRAMGKRPRISIVRHLIVWLARGHY